MKDKYKIGYYDDKGDFIEKKIPRNRMRCYWSQDGKDCMYLAMPNGQVWCEEHFNIMHKINGRKFKDKR